VKVFGLIGNNEKAATSKTHAKFKITVLKPCPFVTKLAKIDTPFTARREEKPYPLGLQKPIQPIEGIVI